MDVAFGLRVSYYHFPPLVSVARFKGHDVPKVWPIVVLGLYRLVTETSNDYVNVANNLSNTPLKRACTMLHLLL